MEKIGKKLLVIMMALVMVMSMGVSVFAEGEEFADGEYVLNEITASSGMVSPEQPATLKVEGDKATLTVEMGETPSKRYSEIYIGNYADITEENQDTIGTEGVPSEKGIKFVVTFDKSKLAQQLNFVVRYKAGYSESHDHDWYNASNHFYFTLGTLSKVEETELAIKNKTGMFKADTAKLKKVGDNESLIMTLSGSGYHELFKGTYEEAVANGDAVENWVHGYENAEGKWEFEIPLENGETYVPVVAISNSYYEKYLAGENELARAFYPRQLEIDREAKTLVTGDYDHTIEVSVKNNVKMFKPGEKADLRIVGGPNSNNYAAFITLHMGSDSMDKVKSHEYTYKNKELVEGDEIEIDAENGTEFKEIPVLPAILEEEETITLEFRSKNKGKWYKRDLSIDLKAKEATFDPYPGEVVVQEIAALPSVEAAIEYAKAKATPEFTDLLIEAIQVQSRDDNTDKLCAAAKAAWDTLTKDQQEEVGEYDYFGLDTGDASKDDPLNTVPDKEKELLVVSFGTSFNNSRIATIGAVEKALAAAYPDWAVRRAFTAQIIINHVQARDEEYIDNVTQAMDKAVAAGVKEMVVQPTHLMSGAEYDELKKEIDTYADKIKISYAKPLLDSDADKEAVAKAVVAAAAKEAEFADVETAVADKDTAFVFMGHGTAHEAKATYTYMQQTMDKLGYKNCFVGTVEGEPEETEVEAVLARVKAAGYKKVILRPLMVVAGDHANNDMAGDDEDSWKSIFGAALGADNVKCQINGLGEIDTVQQLYIAHSKAVIEPADEDDSEAKKKAEIAKVKAGKIKSFKAKAGKKKVTFTWKKNTTFAGYKLKYKAGKKSKTLTIKSAKTAKKIVKKLKKGAKVTAQIRGYKKIAGKTYYGKWAKAKAVKVK